jgi:hypothetical protein
METILDSGLPIDIILNLILVVEDIRPAVLIENEKKKYMKIIQKYYPDLCYSDFGFNFIVSKNKYNKSDITSDETLGLILGYPCAEEFHETLKDFGKYGIHVNVEFTDNNTFENNQIFGNAAINLDKLHIFLEFAKLAEDVLKNNNIVGHLINKVYVEYKYDFSTRKIVDMIKNNNIYDDKLKDRITNELLNIGFSDELSSFNFDFTNMFHKAILLSLITYLINDPLEKFYPYESDDVKNWGDSLLKLLKN